MEKVLILGINGFTGQHFQQYILKNSLSKNYDFIGVDKVINSQSAIRYLKIDLLRPDSIQNIVSNQAPDYIVNLIGTFQSSNFDALLAINAGITQKVLETIVKTKIKIKKVLLIGSAAEYGTPRELPIKEEASLNPVNLYGLSKAIQSRIAQYYCQNYSLPVIIARTFNIIGKGISPTLSIGAFIERIKKAQEGDSIDVGNINTKRDFLDIEDVLDAYWKILLMGKPREIYNVCRGESHYIKDLLEYLIKKAKKSVKININREFFKSNDVLDVYGDNTKLVRDTAWNPKIGVFDALSHCY